MKKNLPVLLICITLLFTTTAFAGGPCTGFTAKITSTISPSCHGAIDGSATVTANGGTTPYTYSWFPSGGNGATAYSISAGSYTVTVTDSNGCTVTATATVYDPPPIMVNMVSTTNIGCNGGADGCITFCAYGGTPPYKYLWNNGASTQTVCGLSAGTYSVSVFDSHLCMGTASVTLTQPTALTANISTFKTVTCYGGNDGSATVSALGGTPSYTYLWAPSGGTNATATGLTAGTYTASVTDAHGCSTSAAITITQCLLTVKPSSITPATCGNSNGAASVIASGCNPPYSYSWSGGQTSSSVVGVVAGTYSVTLTNSLGCTATTSFVIPSGGPSVSISSKANISCYGGSDGIINIIASGGTSPYTYSWTPNYAFGNSATGLSAGTYWCLVRDASGCIGTDSTTLTQPPVLVLNDSTYPTDCTNSIGIAKVFASGGTPGYTYSWTPGGQTSSNATSLSAGTYTCTLTDQNGCSLIQTATVPMSKLSLSFSVNNTYCNGSSDGSITATGSGGQSPYFYNWSNGQTTSTITGLTAGTYTCTVSSGICLFDSSVTVTSPSPLSVITTYTTTICGNNNGAAMASVTGGTSCSGFYNYKWNPTGAPTSGVSGLSAGTYTVTVTDDLDCTATAIAVIAPSSVPNITNIKQVNVLCYGGNTGKIVISADSGIIPYTYNWAPSGGTKDSIYNASAGTYTCTVTDSNGCVSLDTVTITQPPQLVVKAYSSPSTGGCTGSMWAVVTGGTPLYTYTWCNSSTVDSVVNACPGTCCVLVQDHNGCVDTSCTNVPFVTSVSALKAITGVTVYPNPANNALNIKCEAGFKAESLTVYDMTGRKMLEQKITNNSSGKYTLNVSPLAEGTYLLKITSNNKEEITRFAVYKQ